MGLRWLLDKKASPTHYCTKARATPLNEAALLGDSIAITLLLDYGALRREKKGRGALHIAVHKKMFSSVKLLLERGCKVNELYFKKTPLTAALSCGKTGDVRLVQILLRGKADVGIATTDTKGLFNMGNMTTHLAFSKKFSNKRCSAAIKNAINSKLCG